MVVSEFQYTAPDYESTGPSKKSHRSELAAFVYHNRLQGKRETVELF